MSTDRFDAYDGWTDDLRVVVDGGATDQGSLDAAVARLREALGVTADD